MLTGRKICLGSRVIHTAPHLLSVKKSHMFLTSRALQYGRDGWCDGVNVPPHIFDVTKYIRKAGKNNTVNYQGLFLGRDPNPVATPGYIMMQSSLVFLQSNQLSDA